MEQVTEWKSYREYTQMSGGTYNFLLLREHAPPEGEANGSVGGSPSLG